MKYQLNKLITDLGYTATKFADEIGVQRSGISHILSGRNQPSYDFIVKIAKRFPDINLEWLLLGKGTMRKLNEKDKNAQQTSIFLNETMKPLSESNTNGKSENKSLIDNISNVKDNKVTNVTIVEKIVILNSDGTFNQYTPANKD